MGDIACARASSGHSYTLRGINMLHVSSVRNLCTSRTYSIWRQNDAIWCTHKTFALVAWPRWFCFFAFFLSFFIRSVVKLYFYFFSSSYYFQSTFSAHFVPLVPKCATAVCTMDRGTNNKKNCNETSQIENESETTRDKQKEIKHLE